MENYLQRLLDIWGPDTNDQSKALDWIEKSVERRAEEGVYLDFKQKSDARAQSLNDDDKANLAKAISGFANTDGGLIVWGVKAKTNSKEDPDVAIDLIPISNLKTFQTWLNSLAGEIVSPPVAGIDNRIVLNGKNVDTGYVITVVPKKHDTLVQATAKGARGFYIRSGSGFHLLSEVLIAEFYRKKPMSIISLNLQWADPKKVQLFEEVVEAEHWKAMPDLEKKPWGRCTYRQNLTVEWVATLKNEGLGAANQIVVNLTVSAMTKWSIINYKIEKSSYRESSGHFIPVYAPLPTTVFESMKSNTGVGKVLEPIHPGLEVQIASGELLIPFEAFGSNIAHFEIIGFAYADDSPPFPLRYFIDGSELRNRYLQTFNALAETALPAIRVIPEPPTRRIRLDDE